MKGPSFFQKEYYLKYKDQNVLRFNIETEQVDIYSNELLPVSIQNRDVNFETINKFCSDRMLMSSREHCKEILVSCGIDDRSAVNICILSRALTFRDNYWICAANSGETWDKTNLYKNERSFSLSRVALTGAADDAMEHRMMKDYVFTGELTSKGTKAKCFIRIKGQLFLLKNETIGEISSEVITYYIAQLLNLPCTKYRYMKQYGKDCSLCVIETSEVIELIPARDIMSLFGEYTIGFHSKTYDQFMQFDPINFTKMQVLDYVTLNTDRNRDNFGLISMNRRIVGLYPLFDHDGCFKGKSANGVYFPSNVTFHRTIETLKTEYRMIYRSIYPDIQNMVMSMKTDYFKNLFLQYKTIAEYSSMMNRIAKL